MYQLSLGRSLVFLAMILLICATVQTQAYAQNSRYDYPDGEKSSPFGNSPTPAGDYAQDGANFGESFSKDVSKGVSDFKRDGGKLIDKAGSLFGGDDRGVDDFQGVAGSVPMGNDDGAGDRGLFSGDNVEYDYPDGEKGSPFGNSPTPAGDYAQDGANFGESFSNDVSKGVSDFKRDGGKLIDKAGSLFGGGDRGGDDFQGVAGSVPMGTDDGAGDGFLGNSTSDDSFGGVADSVPMGNSGGPDGGGLFSGNNVEHDYPDGEKGSPFGNSPTPASEYAKGDTVGETFVNAADKGLSDFGNDADKVADKVGGLFGGGDNGGDDFQGVAGSVPMGNEDGAYGSFSGNSPSGESFGGVADSVPMGNKGSPNAPGLENVASQIASVETGNFGGQDVISGVATGGSPSGIVPHDFGGKAKGVANDMVQSGAGKFPLKKFQKSQELTGQLGKAAAMGKDISSLNLNNVGQKAGGMAKNMAISEVKSQIGSQLGGMDIGSIGSMDMKGIQQTAGSMPGMSTIASDVTNAAKQAGSKIKSLGSDIASSIGGALSGLF
jgi:hypothetical protein